MTKMITSQGSEKVKIVLLDLLDINFKCCYIIYVNKGRQIVQYAS